MRTMSLIRPASYDIDDARGMAGCELAITAGQVNLGLHWAQRAMC